MTIFKTCNNSLLHRVSRQCLVSQHNMIHSPQTFVAVPILILFIWILTLTNSLASDKLGPIEKVPALLKQPNQTYNFIVRVSSGSKPNPAQLGIDIKDPSFISLEIINAFAVKSRVKRAFELAEQQQVEQVWYLHPDQANLYINTIAALTYNVNNLPLPNLVNLSIGPQAAFWVKKPNVEEPIQLATRTAAEKGLVPIVAIGNSNSGASDSKGWINPWSYPEWVIAVGAWNSNTGKVADFSSRGDPNDPESWPDVVADGVDVIGPFPTNKTKSIERAQRDKSNPHFRKRIAKENWPKYTLESGTSQAAAVVSGAAAQILFFLKNIIANHSNPGTEPLFSLTAEPERISDFDLQHIRLTGRAIPQPDGSVIYEYPIDLPWKMVKQLLIDTAIPIESSTPYEVGAGLIDQSYINEQFGQYGIVKPKIFPSKVL